MVLPVGYHLGLSASTGDLADNHDVKMLKLYEVDLVEGQTFNVEVRIDIGFNGDFFVLLFFMLQNRSR